MDGNGYPTESACVANSNGGMNATRGDASVKPYTWYILACGNVRKITAAVEDGRTSPLITKELRKIGFLVVCAKKHRFFHKVGVFPMTVIFSSWISFKSASGLNFLE